MTVSSASALRVEYVMARMQEADKRAKFGAFLGSIVYGGVVATLMTHDMVQNDTVGLTSPFWLPSAYFAGRYGMTATHEDGVGASCCLGTCAAALCGCVSLVQKAYNMFCADIGQEASVGLHHPADPGGTENEIVNARFWQEYIKFYGYTNNRQFPVSETMGEKEETGQEKRKIMAEAEAKLRRDFIERVEKDLGVYLVEAPEPGGETLSPEQLAATDAGSPGVQFRVVNDGVTFDSKRQTPIQGYGSIAPQDKTLIFTNIGVSPLQGETPGHDDVSSLRDDIKTPNGGSVSLRPDADHGEDMAIKFGRDSLIPPPSYKPTALGSDFATQQRGRAPESVSHYGQRPMSTAEGIRQRSTSPKNDVLPSTSQ